MIGRVVRGVAVVTALMCVVPALASAAQSLGVTSAHGFPAGGDPSYTTTINLDTSAGAPGKVTIALAPGALASVAANPSCSKGAPQYTSACQIGTGSATVLGLVPASLNAYLVAPPASADLVGIDLVPSPNLGLIPTTHIGGQLVQTASGNVQVVLGLDLSSLGSTASLLTTMSLDDQRDPERQAIHADADELLAGVVNDHDRIQEQDGDVDGITRLQADRLLVAAVRTDGHRVRRRGPERRGRRRQHDGDPGSERGSERVNRLGPSVADAYAEFQRCPAAELGDSGRQRDGQHAAARDAAS